MKNYINNLTPRKKEIGEKLIAGETIASLNKQYRSAFVTMVLNGLKAIDKKWFDGKRYNEKAPSKKSTKSNYEEGEGKKIIRNWVLKFIKESAKLGIVDGTILTLSCFQCIMETQINEYFKKFKYLPYECDAVHFSLLTTSIKEKNFNFMLNPVFGEIIEGIKAAKKDTYSHLLLDFCRTLVAHDKDIKLALEKDIVKKGGIVWITLSTRLGRGHKGFNTERELTKLVKDAGGNRYEILNIPHNIAAYNDEGGMYVMVLRRVK